MEVQLDIYIEPNCATCDTANKIARSVKQKMPAVQVSVIDLTRSDADPPLSVFAVPTYVINGQTVSLGNPRENELLSHLDLALQGI